MKFPVPKTFLGAVSPARVAWQILGFGILEYPSGRPRPLLSLCWSIVHIVVFFTCIFFARLPKLSNSSRSEITTYNYKLNTYFCMTFVVVSMILARRTEKTGRCQRRINLINTKLKEFEIPDDFGGTLKYQITHLVIGCLQLVVVWVVGASHKTDKHFALFPAITFWMSINYQLIFIVLFRCFYCTCIGYIDNRFKRLNAIIIKLSVSGMGRNSFLENWDNEVPTLCLMTREIHGDLRLAKAAELQWTVHVLRKTRSVHHALYMVAKEMNQAFGLPVLFYMGMCFVIIATLLFTFCEIYVTRASFSTGLELKNVFVVLYAFTFYVTSLFHTIYCCSTVCSEARRTGDLIHELVKEGASDEVQAEVDSFSFQIKQNPVQFTANGFFKLDYTMIRAIIASVSTYLVILIQMRPIYDADLIMEQMEANATLAEKFDLEKNQ